MVLETIRYWCGQLRKMQQCLPHYCVWEDTSSGGYDAQLRGWGEDMQGMIGGYPIPLE